MAEIKKKEKPDYPEVVGQVQQGLIGKMGLFNGAVGVSGSQPPTMAGPLLGYPEMPSGTADMALAAKKKKEEGSVMAKARKPRYFDQGNQNA